MTQYTYHHLGIPNKVKRDNESYFAPCKMFHTHFDDNPYGIEWLRFEPGSNLPELIKSCPHVAFKVDNLEKALEGQNILIAPNSPSKGVRVAFIEHDGAPIEFLEYDESKQVTGFPVLETERLRLRQFQSEDAESLYALRSNPRVMEYMDLPLMKSPDQAKQTINDVSRNFMSQNMPFWAITLKSDPAAKMIGYLGYFRLLKNHARGEIGYVLGPAHWGKGYMTEALTKVLKFGFEDMELHSIEANVNPDNQSSISILEKFNFSREALFRENWFFNGKYVDSAIYSLLKRHFPK